MKFQLFVWQLFLPVAGGFPSQSASNAESVFMSWRHHVTAVGIQEAFLQNSSVETSDLSFDRSTSARVTTETGAARDSTE